MVFYRDKRLLVRKKDYFCQYHQYSAHCVRQHHPATNTNMPGSATPQANLHYCVFPWAEAHRLLPDCLPPCGYCRVGFSPPLARRVTCVMAGGGKILCSRWAKAHPTTANECIVGWRVPMKMRQHFHGGTVVSCRRTPASIQSLCWGSCYALTTNLVSTIFRGSAQRNVCDGGRRQNSVLSVG